MNRLWQAIACASLLSTWAGPATAAPGPKDAKAVDKDWVIYLGCGEVRGAGTVVQLDQTGKVLGTVDLDSAPYGLAATPGGLVAALPGGGAGQVVRIDKAGKAEALLRDPAGLPSPIAVACDPATGDVYVGDNRTDVLMRLPKGEAKSVERMLTFPGLPNRAQNLSLAFARGDRVLYGGSEPKGVYRFKAGKDAALGDPVLTEDAGVAADTGSDRWVAVQPNQLRVFEETKELLALPYPAGRRAAPNAVAVAPGGIPVVALRVGATKYEVVRADVAAKEFKTLFERDGARIVCLAVGPRLAWKN